MSKPGLITVCDKCLRASCWQGIFFCDEPHNAGVVQKTLRQLRKLALESPDYWLTDDENLRCLKPGQQPWRLREKRHEALKG